MSDLPAQDGDPLDRALAELRREEPTAPLRRDLVWNQVEAARATRSSVLLVGGISRRWVAAATVTFLAAGALTVGRWWERGSVPEAHSAASGDPLMSDAASIFRALRTAPAEAGAADSLHVRSALLLAAARAAADAAPEASERARLLHDVEYVLAQVVEGGLEDEVERELTIDAIRDRRLLARIEQGGAE